ncbi:MAG: tetraacyldisaccharide 4'-kinase [Rudaea sp.]|uniref:tetraacyldisaccharide 4'-kinase n=1 Tax=Rudaea sp. TaxID=2136325 RepID=UPI0039E21B07
MSLSQRLPEIWYGDEPPPLWLRALVPVYRGLRTLHRAPYTFGWKTPQRLAVPVIVVGNLTVGGTGKTPLVIALVEALRERGRRAGVISRGYGGGVSAPELLGADSDAACVGDEPVLIHAATGVPVAVGRDRVAAGRLLLGHHDCDVLVADDGLQHPGLFRDVEICVIDGERHFGNGLLLPAGPLREPPSRLDSVDFRVRNGGVAQVGEAAMRLAGDTAVSLSDPTLQKPLRDFASRRVHAVAGIGNPARFFAMLRAAGIEVVEHAFADHHVFTASDIDFGDDAPVLMTAKDAVKCRAFARPDCWQVPVRADLPEAFFDAVRTRIDGFRKP